MKILVTGATGFIASTFVDALTREGHELTVCVRDTDYAKRIFPKATVISCNFDADNLASIWLPRLKDIDCVINVVGILYHPNSKKTWAVHYDTPKALFEACDELGVGKIIQISALGIEACDVPYATSKLAAENFLKTIKTPSVILRPSLVVGRGAYGGTALFRGLAGLPYFTPIPGDGEQMFQPILLEDLSKAICHLVEMPFEGCTIYSAVGPERITMKSILSTLRAWLGFPASRVIYIPRSLIRWVSKLGDLIPYSSTNSTSYEMMQQSNIATENETQAFHERIGFIPQSFTQGVFDYPSSVQDQWHARLSFLPDALRVSLAFVWIFTALCSSFISRDLSLQYTTNFWILSSSLLDAALGCGLLIKKHTRLIGSVQIGMMLIYMGLATLIKPSLWFDPLGSLIKNIPLIIATLILMGMDGGKR